MRFARIYIINIICLRQGTTSCNLFLHKNYYGYLIMFTLSFYCDAKRKSEPRKKNTLLICNPLDCSSPDGRTSVPLQAVACNLLPRLRTTARSRHSRLKRGSRGVPCLLGHFNRVFLFLLPAFSFSACLLAINGTATPSPARRRFALCSQSALLRNKEKENADRYR